MDRLLMIADDLTGALDAGVAFAEAGFPTCVYREETLRADLPQCQVLVWLVPTRHLPEQEAYRAVYRAVAMGREQGFRYIYKKTDSALRGNIGAELSACAEAAGAKQVFFLPAYPKMNRPTRNGVQYIDDNVPVGESVFASDPFNPVHQSAVLDILKETTSFPAALAAPADGPLPEGILVFDAENQEMLLDSARWILNRPEARVLAGCAGFAGALAQLLKPQGEREQTVLPRGNLMVFCGSVNPISLEQCRRAVDSGAPSYQLIQNGAFADLSVLARQAAQSARSAPITVVTTGAAAPADDAAAAGRTVAQKMGQVIAQAAAGCPEAVTVIIGGDTLQEFLRQRNIESIYPYREPFPGVVLASYSYQGRVCYLLSKSGGFGTGDFLMELQKMLNRKPDAQELGGG